MLEKKVLGLTGIEVSEICFGSLTLGPLQARMSLGDGSNLLEYAFSRGINFIDTAEYYETYPYIKEFLRDKIEKVKINREDIVIATKSFAFDKKGAERSLGRAMKEMGVSYLDVFLLHEQESEHTIRGHWEAAEYFIKAKEKGYIRAFGISTHSVNAVQAALKIPEIEIIHPLINKKGLGIINGTRDEMIHSINLANELGKGIYGMKVLGGGNLISEYESSMDFVLALKSLHSIAVGMQSKAEIDANIEYVKNRSISEGLKNMLKTKKRKLHIEKYCSGCGMCVNRCGSGALEIVKGKAIVNVDKCVLCGYCSAVCKEFCIKVI